MYTLVRFTKGKAVVITGNLGMRRRQRIYFKRYLRLISERLRPDARNIEAFAAADAARLQRQLPETVLNEIELFLFGIGEDTDMEEAKND